MQTNTAVENQALGNILRHSREIETLLVDRFGAEGRGLHEKASSVERHLTSDQMRIIRRIASIRNQAVHDAKFENYNLSNFERDCNRVLLELGGTTLGGSDVPYSFRTTKGRIAIGFVTTLGIAFGVRLGISETFGGLGFGIVGFMAGVGAGHYLCKLIPFSRL